MKAKGIQATIKMCNTAAFERNRILNIQTEASVKFFSSK